MEKWLPLTDSIDRHMFDKIFHGLIALGNSHLLHLESWTRSQNFGFQLIPGLIIFTHGIFDRTQQFQVRSGTRYLLGLAIPSWDKLSQIFALLSVQEIFALDNTCLNIMITIFIGIFWLYYLISLIIFCYIFRHS